MDHFAPLSALMGGLMIGASAALLLVLNGRIAGISGILAGVFERRLAEAGWRAAFLTGILLAPVVYAAFGGAWPRVTIEGSAGLIVVSGLLVGFGTRLGSGCTSGHGVCGLSRGSARSLVATCIFMVTAVLTVLIARHAIGG